MNNESNRPRLMLVAAVAIGALIGGGMSALPFVFGVMVGVFVPLPRYTES